MVLRLRRNKDRMDDKMVYVYLTNISNLPDPAVLPQIMEGLWEERKDKILRYKYAENRKQSLGAGLLLKWALERHGAAAENIKYGPNGKPELDGVYFNLSHSEEWVACAISQQSVGCDVEKIGPVNERIAKRFFSENEVRYLDALEGEKKQEEFFRLWTMKESYMKMTGEGMTLGLDRVEFKLEEPVKAYRDGLLCRCSIKEYELPGYKVAICAEEENFADGIQYVAELILQEKSNLKNNENSK